MFVPYIKRKVVAGTEFDFFVGNVEGRTWYDSGKQGDWIEMQFVRDHMVLPGDVVLECGAHHGCTTIMLSKWVGAGGRVVAFEPDFRNLKVLRRNIQINGLTNVIVESKAVGGVDGRIRFAPDSGVLSSSSDRDPSAQEIEVTRLDQYAELAPTLLKIDVEGYEYDVLKGSSGILKARPRLQLEIHPRQLLSYGHSVSELLALIPMEQYDIQVQWSDDSEPRRYDGVEPIHDRVHLFATPKKASE